MSLCREVGLKNLHEHVWTGKGKAWVCVWGRGCVCGPQENKFELDRGVVYIGTLPLWAV